MPGLMIDLAGDGFEDGLTARLDVEELLATSPPKQARAIRSTRVQGPSVSKAAQANGIEEADVKVSVHRGIKAPMTRVQGARS